MPQNEILEELWRIKDELWREADGDMGKFCDQLQEWSAKHPFQGRILKTPEEVRRFVKGEAIAAPSVREDDPPKYGGA